MAAQIMQDADQPQPGLPVRLDGQAALEGFQCLTCLSRSTEYVAVLLPAGRAVRQQANGLAAMFYAFVGELVPGLEGGGTQPGEAVQGIDPE